MTGDQQSLPSDVGSDDQGKFDAFAEKVDKFVSRPTYFFASVLSILLWALWGPFAHFSSTWQLVINTSTTILTFVLVGLAANSSSRDSKAMQIKLNAIASALEDLLEREEHEGDAEELRQAVGLEQETGS